MIDGTVTDELRRCRSCGWWTRWLSVHGRCRYCTLGWTHCSLHGRLEHDDNGAPLEDGGHRRVSVAEVLAAIPDTRRTAA